MHMSCDSTLLTHDTFIYMQHLPNTPYALETAAEGVAEESSPKVKLQLLTAVMKMFFKRPPECQETLGRLLDHAISESLHIITIAHHLMSKVV